MAVIDAAFLLQAGQKFLLKLAARCAIVDRDSISRQLSAARIDRGDTVAAPSIPTDFPDRAFKDQLELTSTVLH